MEVKKKNVPPSFTVISMVKILKKKVEVKHSGKYINVLIQKTKLLSYIAWDALKSIPVMCDISSYELLCVDHDWTSRFCFSVPMSTLYINLWWMQNLTMHINGCVWWLLMFFIIGGFCSEFFVLSCMLF